MKKKTDSVVCKQCGKIIVGTSKVGLCESCFNKNAGAAVGILGLIGVLWKPIKKHTPKLLKEARDLYKNIK